VTYGASVAVAQQMLRRRSCSSTPSSRPSPSLHASGTLRAELGGRAAVGISAGNIVLALLVGRILARLLGIA
jgi:hypothetical protein